MKIDTTGCECIGVLSEDDAAAWRLHISICWDCLVPSRDCVYLRNGKMYEGSIFWETSPKEDGKMKGQKGYRVVKCPHYRGGQDG